MSQLWGMKKNPALRKLRNCRPNSISFFLR
jgi:hypothetical protein